MTYANELLEIRIVNTHILNRIQKRNATFLIEPLVNFVERFGDALSIIERSQVVGHVDAQR